MLTILQIILSVILIGLILLQERSGESSALFGGMGGGSGSYQTRRGLERIVYWATIVSAGLFALLALLNLVFKI